ncbi:cysteine-rich DPF motif domain-containing protein 1 isoform 2-T2 [Trichechus inunguis]
MSFCRGWSLLITCPKSRVLPSLLLRSILAVLLPRQMASEAERRPQGVFECQLCALSAPYSYVGQKPPNTRSVVNAVYSTPRDFASLVSGRTSMLSHRKSGKTWTRGKLWPGRPAASPVLGPEGSQGPSGQPLHGALGDSCGPGQAATELEAVVPGFIPGLCLQPGELSRPACSSNRQTQDKHLASPAQALQGSSSAEDPGALGVAGPQAQRPWDSSCPEREAQAGLLVLPLPGAGG